MRYQTVVSVYPVAMSRNRPGGAEEPSFIVGVDSYRVSCGRYVRLYDRREMVCVEPHISETGGCEPSDPSVKQRGAAD